MRQLDWMVEEKGLFQWTQTSALMAVHINANRKPGSPPVKAEDLNPFFKKKKPGKMIVSTGEAMKIMNKLFCK